MKKFSRAKRGGSTHKKNIIPPKVRILSILVCLFIVVATTSCLKHEHSAVPWQSIVDSFAFLTENLSPPWEFKRSEDAEEINKFRINKYFYVLNHLRMEPCYILDYVYLSGGVGGFPIIYARKIEEPAFLNFKEFKDARGDITSDEYWARIYGESGTKHDSSLYGYMDHIEIDDTLEGYFQFMVLRIIGSQFYRFWHALYNDHKIVCDYAAFESLLANLEKPPMELILPQRIANEAMNLDFEPLVKFGEKTVMVRIVVFTKWGGFIQRSFITSRSFPHRVLKEEKKTLVNYDCGIAY